MQDLSCANMYIFIGSVTYRHIWLNYAQQHFTCKIFIFYHHIEFVRYCISHFENISLVCVCVTCMGFKCDELT